MSTGKGIKRTKNNPVFYAELKKGHEIFLTDSSWQKVKQTAKEKGISASEYIEQLIRNPSVPRIHEGSAKGNALPTCSDCPSHP